MSICVPVRRQTPPHPTVKSTHSGTVLFVDGVRGYRQECRTPLDLLTWSVGPFDVGSIYIGGVGPVNKTTSLLGHRWLRRHKDRAGEPVHWVGGTQPKGVDILPPGLWVTLVDLSYESRQPTECSLVSYRR